MVVWWLESSMSQVLESMGRKPPATPKKAVLCSLNNKNTETDIAVQPEDQESKAAKSLERSHLSIFRLKAK